MISKKGSLITGTLLTLAISPLVWADQPAVPSGIADVLERKVQAWNAGDAQAWGADYIDDSIVINLAGMRLEGSEANIDRHAEVFAGPLVDTTLEIDVVDIHELTSYLAVVEARLAVNDVSSDMDIPAVTDAGVLHTRMSFLMRKVSNTDWQIQFAQNTPVTDPDSASYP
ncbi:MAG: SgcJ/EcaC family oxidoreductase [Pseudomonadaceae bacterium]|nr:MAG: SgcJ/EcaC family oxidoreductase [Pseudomonadaceae bacterium]